MEKIAKKAEEQSVLGGAGGAADQIQALKDTADMASDMPDTQEDADEDDAVVDKIMKDMKNLAEAGGAERPSC